MIGGVRWHGLNIPKPILRILWRWMPKQAGFVFLIPALPVANYNLQVRAHFSKDGELRGGTLSAELTVPAPPI